MSSAGISSSSVLLRFGSQRDFGVAKERTQFLDAVRLMGRTSKNKWKIHKIILHHLGVGFAHDRLAIDNHHLVTCRGRKKIETLTN
jgi:hypothetical protein